MLNSLFFKYVSRAVSVLLFCFVYNVASAQNITNYGFTASAGTFTALVGGTTPGGLGTTDDGAFNNIPIGFDFWYMGVKYTTISAGTNGLLSLGGPITAAGYLNTDDLSATGGTNRPILAPLWDNLNIVAGANFTYLTTGAVGSRLFTCQYLTIRWNYLAASSAISFQVILDEATGKVSFVYRPETGAINAGGASIGITATAIGNSNYLSLNNSTAGAVASSTVSTTNISTKPVAGQTYSFRSTVNAPTSLTFTGVSSTGMTLNWVDNATDENGYVIYQSTDGGSTYTYAALTAANATSYAATGLNAYTNYFWKVFALRETLSSPLAGSQNMALAATYAYPFNGNANDAAGTPTNDVSGNNNNGTLVGGVTPATDRFGNANSAYTFNGSTGNITTTTKILTPGPQVFSISIWFKTTTTQGGKLIGFGNQQSGGSGQYDRHVYMDNNGKLYFGIYNGGFSIIASTTAYNDNVWHNAIGILSGTGMKFYVDGVSIGTNANTAAENHDGYWRIGYDALGGGWQNAPTSPFFAGSLDDIQIFNREISVPEINGFNNALFNGYAYKKTITLNTTNIIAGTQTNFPYLISITDPDLKQTTNGCDLTGGNTSFGKVTSITGADIAFTTTDGVALPYDIDKYDPATGSLLVWVKLPSVSNATNLAINMLFGKLAPGTNNEATVWSDYKTVFHFKENMYTGTTKDATAGLVGTNTGMTATNLVAGKIGTAYNFNGTTQKIEVQSSPAYAITSSPYTLSAWINIKSTTPPFDDQKIIGNQTSAGFGYKMGLNTNTTYGTNPEMQSDGNPDRFGQPNTTGPFFTTALNTWYYVQGVYNGTTLAMYVNGVAQQTRTGIGAPSAGGVLNIGVGEGGNAFWFNGIIDEPRVSQTAKDANWGLSEYRNQNNPGTTGTLPSVVLPLGGLQADAVAASTYPGLVYTFTGATSATDFSALGNFTNNTINLTELPASTAKVSVVIPTGKSPMLFASKSFYGVSIANGAILALNGNTLNVGCNVYNSGQIFYNASLVSSLNFNGSLATQDYFGNASTSNLGNLIINNSASGTININASSNLNVYNTLTLIKGNLSTSVIGTGKFTLKSFENQTASVASIPAGSAISGNFYVERFMKGGNTNARRGFRLMSSPVHAPGVPLNYNIFNLKQNMYISGSPDAANIGASDPNSATVFDWSPNHNPTIYRYNEPVPGAVSQYDYAPISLPLTGNIFKVGEGAYVFFRGLRSATGNRFSTSLPVEDNTLVYNGVVNQGSYSPALTYTNTGSTADGYNLVGNPYPSTIDVTSTGITYTNLTPFINVLNPQTKVFNTYNRTTGVSTGNASKFIASGQGFFVQRLSGAPAITFGEGAKVDQQLLTNPTAPTLLMSTSHFKQIDSKPQYLKMLFINQADSTAQDDIVIEFNESGKEKFDGAEDASDMGGNGTTFLSSYSSDNIKLAINDYPAITKDTKIKLSVLSYLSGSFNLIATEVASLDKKYEALLIDNFKVDTIKLATQSTYGFSIDRSVPETYRDGRFEVAFAETPLMVNTLSNFYGSGIADHINVGWKIGVENKPVVFTLEKSIDTINFHSLTSFSSDAREVYSYIDKQPNIGDNYYRLIQTDVNDQTSYSSVINIKYDGLPLSNTGFTVYPIPVINKLNITLNKIYDNETTVRIYNISGQVVTNAAFTGDSTSIDFAKFSPGVYIIEITNSNKTIGRSKFIKQ
ncbi:hypothetical protein ABIB40_003570 [Pedobacter sp. UYP30]|uniref:DUF2341 domain-containing protein n=1 Tax=Pedobacter sp. UYP30 TaxID=1756400 RepID=UPI003398BE90